MLKTSAFWIISIGIGAMIGITGAVTISLVPHAAAQGFSVMQSSLLVSVVGSGAFIGKVSFGALSDHVELRWAMRGGLVLMLASTAMLLLGGSYPLLLAASALFGLSLGGMMPVWAVLVAHVFGLASCGSALGATRAAMAPFALACPLIAGWAFDLFQSYSYAWAIFCALLLCCLVSTFILRGWSTPLQVASNPPEIVS
jgi:MFS family permease